jgi:hypothetical protein
MLSTNQLQAIPPSLFDIENLTVLSLRANWLTDIPSAISRLQRLEELNLASNKLRWLPYEMISLLKNPRLSANVQPNPFVVGYPPGPAFDFPNSFYGYQDVKDFLKDRIRYLCSFIADPSHDDPTRERACWRLSLLNAQYLKACKDAGSTTPFRVGSTAPALFTPTGSPFHSSPPAPSLLDPSTSYIPASLDPPHDLADLDPQYQTIMQTHLGATHPTPRRTTPRQPPSLFELALRSCAASPRFASIPALLPLDAPRSVTAALDTARELKALGGQACSVCGAPYVLPRTEWLEWWFVSGEEAGGKLGWALDGLVPFLRRGCSVGCLPDV